VHAHWGIMAGMHAARPFFEVPRFVLQTRETLATPALAA
jgi:hypothetical protein